MVNSLTPSDKTTEILTNAAEYTSQLAKKPSKVKNEGDRYKHYFRIKIGGKTPPTTDNTLSSAFAGELAVDDTAKLQLGISASTNEVGTRKSEVGSKELDKTIKIQRGDTPSSLEVASTEQATKSAARLGIESFSKTSDFRLPTSDFSKNSEFTFDSSTGDIIGTPYVTLSTKSYNYAEFIILDPDDKIRPQLAQHQNVEIEIGFVNGVSVAKFTGVIWRIGRRMPDGTKIEAVDPTALEAGTTSGVHTSRTGINQSGVIDPNDKNVKLDILTPSTDLVELISSTNAGLQTRSPIAQTVFDNNLTATEAKTFLVFENKSRSTVDKEGDVLHNESPTNAASAEAAKVGDKIAVQNDKLVLISPGNEPESGVTLDYSTNRAAFIGHPTITKPTPVQLQSAFGSFTVQGWDTRNKTSTGATVVVPASPTTHPTGIINAPEWGSIKLNDPIFAGSMYTWGDATKNGSRVPATKQIMEGIIKIAQVLTDLTRQTGQQKFKINSWYRTPAANQAAGGAVNSRHLVGDAVDFNFPGMIKLHEELKASWNGGVARCGNSFIHIDLGSKRRWNY